MKKTLFITTILKWTLLLLVLTLTIMPLLWLLVSSFKTNLEFETNPFALPKIWQWRNYLNALSISDLPRLLVNSLITATMATSLNVLVATLAAFIFARIPFRFSNAILNIVLAGILVPIIALMVPYLRVIASLGLLDTLLGLILVYAAINIPISLFLIHGFMRSIPSELDEAALIDGCSIPRRFFSIIAPLSRLGIVTSATFVFLYCWNEFIYALLLTSSVGSRTIQLGIRFFRSQFFTDFTSMFAAITITMIPTILVYIFLHDKIISGLTAGAVKG